MPIAWRWRYWMGSLYVACPRSSCIGRVTPNQAGSRVVPTLPAAVDGYQAARAALPGAVRRPAKRRGAPNGAPLLLIASLQRDAERVGRGAAGDRADGGVAVRRSDGELGDAVARVVADVDREVVDRDVLRVVEVRQRGVRPDVVGRDVAAEPGLLEHREPVRLLVGDVDVPVAVDRDPARRGQPGL